MRFLPGFACLMAVAINVTSISQGADLASVPTFEKDIRPILKASCFHCHGESGEVEGALDVRLARLILKGGDSGAAVVPGNREESALFQRVRDGEMPPDKAHRLSPEQIEKIGQWIDAGAKASRPEPEQIVGMLITEEERSHWAYQKITRPPVPDVKNPTQVQTPIDSFLLQKLEEKGFGFSPEAPSAKLVRRAYLNLTGLPPSPEDVAKFDADSSPDRWGRLIDRLLASPHYGERWGRHWLDVAGYADSDGYSVQDTKRDHAWRYRDYVIRAFNEDKPFDRFLLEQLAGDELITSPINNLTAGDAELLVATGFLRMAPDGTSGTVESANVARNDSIAETVKIVTSSLLGMTVGCAQCHDHRYDPIPITDYYGLRAIFDPALNWKAWKTPRQRLVSLYTDEDRAAAAEIDLKAKELETARLAKQKELIDATFEKELAKLPEEVRSQAVGLQNIAVKNRTAEQAALVKKYPSLNISAGSLYLYDKKAADELKKMADAIKAVRDTKPKEEFVHALTEPSGVPPKSFVFHRGGCDQPKDEVQPAGLSIVSMNVELPEIPVKNPDLPTSGRRTAFARQLTDPNHPLTSRVLVNRIWMHHFGRGLVATPADFGALGTPPTHPELLDWLASEFMSSGWSVKHIHRLIMNSAAYRQSVRVNMELEQADPDNHLYGGANLNRLDAETLRDSVLAVSGTLNSTMYGPPVPVMADESGRWVLGIENLSAGRPGPVIPLNGRENVRSIYVEARRSRPFAVLDTFDWPTMAPNCEIRRPSTGTPQSLMLMNSDFVMHYSAKFARRIEADAPTDLQKQVSLAWQLAYGRFPTTEEAEAAEEFLNKQALVLADRSKPAPAQKGKEKVTPLTGQQLSLNSLCQLLLISNEFLYVD